MFKALTEFQSLHWYCSKSESLVQEMLKASQDGETTKNLSVEDSNPSEPTQSLTNTIASVV